MIRYDGNWDQLSNRSRPMRFDVELTIVSTKLFASSQLENLHFENAATETLIKQIDALSTESVFDAPEFQLCF